MLTLPDINRLKVFYVVYTSRSLVAAAQSLNITRSAVSQSLKAFEADLGMRLFIRDSKKLSPTQPAEILFRSVEPLMAELRLVLQELETGRREPTGHLRIGAPQDFGSTHLTDVIVKFQKENPKITFDCQLATPRVLLESLRSGKLDLTFVDNGDVHAKDFPVSIVTVMEERLVMVCSKNYFNDHLKKTKASFSGLKKMDFIDYLPHAPVVRMWFKDQFGKPDSELNVVFSAESVRAVIKAIKGGLGLGVVPEHMIESELKSGQLVLIDPEGRELINKITLARLLNKPISAREKRFVDFHKKSLEQSDSMKNLQQDRTY